MEKQEESSISIKEIELWMKGEGYEFTDCIEESIYILPDGQLISGGFDMGLIATEQKLTAEQVNLLEDAGATIEAYCKSLNKTKQAKAELER